MHIPHDISSNFRDFFLLSKSYILLIFVQPQVEFPLYPKKNMYIKPKFFYLFILFFDQYILLKRKLSVVELKYW